MKTRMEKYYNDSAGGRSSRNQNLYNEVYEEDYYAELGTVDRNNEIDITEVRQMIENRENYQRAKQYREALGTKLKPMAEEKKEEVQEEKIYDIHQVMEQAKQNRKQGEEEYRKLSDTKYDVLSKIDIDDLEKQAQELLEKNRKEEAELKELINTISSQTLAKQTKEALALDLLEDLKETKTIQTTTATATLIKPVVKEEDQEKTGEMDKSFFTTSAIFDKNDFEDFEDVKESKKIDGVLVNILIFLVIIIVIILVLFLVKNLL